MTEALAMINRLGSIECVGIKRLAKLIDVGGRAAKIIVASKGFPKPLVIHRGRPLWSIHSISLWMTNPKAFEEMNRLAETKTASIQSAKVYFFRAGAFVKIGVAICVDKRLSTVQTGCPELITVAHVMDGGFAVEAELHEKFAAHRVRPNGEWFHWCNEIAEFIAGGT